jgi:hypothetical protein
VAFFGRGEIEERSLHFGRDDRPWESAQGGSDRSTESVGGSTENSRQETERSICTRLEQRRRMERLM